MTIEGMKQVSAGKKKADLTKKVANAHKSQAEKRELKSWQNMGGKAAKASMRYYRKW